MLALVRGVYAGDCLPLHVTQALRSISIFPMVLEFFMFVSPI